MKSEAEDAIYARTAGEYVSGMFLNGMEYAGYIMLDAKIKESYDDPMAAVPTAEETGQNAVYIIWRGTVSSSDGQFSASKIYFPVEYDGIVKLPGDEYMTTASRGIHGSSYMEDNPSYPTSGYADGAEMFVQVVNVNRESYAYEVVEGLKQFDE